MKRTEKIRTILIYLLQREDTTPVAPLKYALPDGEGIVEKIPWLGVVKAVFWALVAISFPIFLCLLTR